jgi:hypothetical protein
MQFFDAAQRRQQAVLKVHQKQRSEIVFSLVQKITGSKKGKLEISLLARARRVIRYRRSDAARYQLLAISYQDVRGRLAG